MRIFQRLPIVQFSLNFLQTFTKFLFQLSFVGWFNLFFFVEIYYLRIFIEENVARDFGRNTRAEVPAHSGAVIDNEGSRLYWRPTC